LKVLGAGGCGAAALLAGHSLYRHAASQALPERASEPNRPFALFDVDSRELNSAGDGLDFRARVKPLVDCLKRLYAVGELLNEC
jgi:hypothetical protein